MASGEDLRRLMGRFPAGVAVVSINLEGERLGVTVGSLVPLSLEPPLVGISVGCETALHELLRRAAAFAVSLLGAGQAELASRFARGIPPIALWQGVRTRPGAVTAAPLLEESLGWLECTVWAEYPAGDHTFFIGEVAAVQEGRPDLGLVYREHGYHPA